MRLVFHELLRFYDRYEILLASKDSKVKPDEVLDGVQTFLALDHGLKSNAPTSAGEIQITSSHESLQSDYSISTAVRVRNDQKDESAVEVSTIVIACIGFSFSFPICYQPLCNYFRFRLFQKKRARLYYDVISMKKRSMQRSKSEKSLISIDSTLKSFTTTIVMNLTHTSPFQRKKSCAVSHLKGLIILLPKFLLVSLLVVLEVKNG